MAKNYFGMINQKEREKEKKERKKETANKFVGKLTTSMNGSILAKKIQHVPLRKRSLLLFEK
jgi:hypothetical protein